MISSRLQCIPTRKLQVLTIGAISLVALLYLLVSRTESLGVTEELPFPWNVPVINDGELDTLALVASIASFSLQSPYTASFNLTLCAAATHENAFLPEWLVYHRLLGVERFVLFDNSPTEEMRELLRPFLDEGSVLLYELQYPPGTNIGEVWQRHLLNLCTSHIFPHTNWAFHSDVDEFLYVQPSASSAPLPTFDEEEGWTYPLHAILNGRLRTADCVPIARIGYVNYGVIKLEKGVVETHVTRENLRPGRATWGKSFIHAKYEGKSTPTWMGPHTCNVGAGIIMDAHGEWLTNPYPASGLPLPVEAITLLHYVQRSLYNCYEKVDVLSDAPHDWRTVDGKAGCAKNYFPRDEEMVEPGRTALLDEPNGQYLVERESLDGFTTDIAARDSWAGRMTAAILNEWTTRGRMGHKDATGPFINIISLQMQ